MLKVHKKKRDKLLDLLLYHKVPQNPLHNLAQCSWYKFMHSKDKFTSTSLLTYRLKKHTQPHCALSVRCKPFLISPVYLCVQGLMSRISSSLRQSLSPSYRLLSLRNVTLFSVQFMFTVESLLFSPCCLHVLEDKVNTLSQFALPL